MIKKNVLRYNYFDYFLYFKKFLQQPDKSVKYKYIFYSKWNNLVFIISYNKGLSAITR